MALRDSVRPLLREFIAVYETEQIACCEHFSSSHVCTQEPVLRGAASWAVMHDMPPEPVSVRTERLPCILTCARMPALEQEFF